MKTDVFGVDMDFRHTRDQLISKVKSVTSVLRLFFFDITLWFVIKYLLDTTSERLRGIGFKVLINNSAHVQQNMVILSI